MLGFAFGANETRAELLMSHCGIDLNQAWLPYMESRTASRTIEFKQKVTDMGQQVLSALRKLHEVGFCHWDIKLDNICINDGYYYMIDFAFSQRIDNIPSRNIKHFKGNSMFASIRKFNMHPTAGSVDDIESLLYLLCFCMDEFYLPWLQDYINQTSTNQFIDSRLKKKDRHH